MRILTKMPDTAAKKRVTAGECKSCMSTVWAIRFLSGSDCPFFNFHLYKYTIIMVYFP